MKNYQYEVSGKEISLKEKCLLCGEKITDEEFAFEDYFVVFRGVTKKAFRGLICFDCYTTKSKK